METNPTNELRIAALEHDLRAAEGKAQRYSQELEKLRLQYAEDLYDERQLAKRLHDERHQLQLDYERLRVQKGGFGLKAMALSGFGGFISAATLFLLFWFLRPADEHTATFARFRDAHLFQFERAISEGRFEDVESTLRDNQDLPENKLIKPEIEFARKLVGAAKRRCGE